MFGQPSLAHISLLIFLLCLSFSLFSPLIPQTLFPLMSITHSWDSLHSRNWYIWLMSQWEMSLLHNCHVWRLIWTLWAHKLFWWGDDRGNGLKSGSWRRGVIGTETQTDEKETLLAHLSDGCPEKNEVGLRNVPSHLFQHCSN